MMFGWRFWSLSLLSTLGAALLIGIPTVLIPNTFFARMTPSSAQDYIIWGISVVLIGPVMALAILYPMPFQLPSRALSQPGGIRVLFGSLLSFFNPLRPFLGIASIILLGITLVLRVRVLRSGCPVRLNNADMTVR